MTKPREWPPKEFELCKGPRDGVKVKRTGTTMPEVIFVGREWFGGYDPWSTEQSSKFPHRYVLDAYKFVYRPEKKRKDNRHAK